MRVGLTYQQTLDIPFGELLDYITIEQVKVEGFRLKNKIAKDEEIIPDVR